MLLYYIIFVVVVVFYMFVDVRSEPSAALKSFNIPSSVLSSVLSCCSCSVLFVVPLVYLYYLWKDTLCSLDRGCGTVDIQKLY